MNHTVCPFQFDCSRFMRAHIYRRTVPSVRLLLTPH